MILEPSRAYPHDGVTPDQRTAWGVRGPRGVLGAAATASVMLFASRTFRLAALSSRRRRGREVKIARLTRDRSPRPGQRLVGGD